MVGWSAIWAVLRQPHLWFEALRAASALARDGWWRRPPFLPIPNRSYMRWRVATAYGSADHAIDPDDLVAYLEWRKRQRSSGGK